MIEIRNVTKEYGQHTAVDDVSLSVSAGETMGLLGPNGAGKTTLMRMITGYLPPTSGEVFVAGFDMYEQPDEVKKRVGYLPEHPPIYLDMTVKEYLCFAGEIHGLEGSALKEGIEKAADYCGISDKLGRLAGNLSKGYRQRVGLAQALIHDPEILILDEPTVGLDPKQVIEIRGLISGLGKNRTVLLSSHILQEVKAVCTSVAIIHNGRLLVTDSIDSLSERLGDRQSLFLRVARRDRVNMAGLEAVQGVLRVKETGDGVFELSVSSDRDCREEISRAVVHMDAGLLELRSLSSSLEDIFLRVIADEG